jgi:hypothetical protein
MRDKILTLISLQLAPFEQTVANFVNTLTMQFKSGFAELPPEAAESVAITEAALNGRRAVLEEEIAKVYELHFTEKQADELIAYHQSATGRHLADVGPVIQQEVAKLSDEWLTATLRSIEPQLTKLLGTEIMPSGGIGEGATTAEQVAAP